MIRAPLPNAPPSLWLGHGVSDCYLFDGGRCAKRATHSPVASGVWARGADSRKFEMQSLAGQALHRPQRKVARSVPYSTAMEWHQANVFQG